MNNLVAVDKGALTMVENVLKRAGKNEVCAALTDSCVDISEYRKVGVCNYFAMKNGAYQSGCHEVIQKSRPNEAYYCVCGNKIKLSGSE